jgi:hypothetical protein
MLYREIIAFDIHSKHKFIISDALLIKFTENQSLYMFRALLAHSQDSLQKRHLVCCVRVMSVGCGTVAVKLLVYSKHYTPASV